MIKNRDLILYKKVLKSILLNDDKWFIENDKLFFNDKNNIYIDINTYLNDEYVVNGKIKKSKGKYNYIMNVYFLQNKRKLELHYKDNKHLFMMMSKCIFLFNMNYFSKRFSELFIKLEKYKINENILNSINISFDESKEIKNFHKIFNDKSKEIDYIMKNYDNSGLNITKLSKISTRRGIVKVDKQLAMNKLMIKHKKKSKSKTLEKQNYIIESVVENDIYKDSTSLGVFGDILGEKFNSNNYKVEMSEVDKSLSDNIKITYEDMNNGKYHRKKVKNNSSFYKNKKESSSNVLVLWDIENINFRDDFSIFTTILPKDAIKVFSYSKKNHEHMKYLKGSSLDFVLRKLKKRGWISRRTKKIADNELIDEFNKRKNKINKLILISEDRDFKEICDKSIEMGIELSIINKNKNKNSWFKKEKYGFEFLDDKLNLR